MTAVSLLDILLHNGASVTEAIRAGKEPVERLAGQLVESSLDDWKRVRQYEADFTPSNWIDREMAIEIGRSIHALHVQWAGEAEQILSRVEQLMESGCRVPKADALRDAIGMTRALLKLTPEGIAGAMDQVQSGQFTPARELRNELDARLRA